jgi:hypothetical protein
MEKQQWTSVVDRHVTRLICLASSTSRDSLSCVIHDYSYEGARIVIFDPINVPNEVELHIRKETGLCMPQCDGDTVTK